MNTKMCFDAYRQRLHNSGLICNQATALMMGCDHQSFVQIGPLVGELLHFQHFAIWLPFAILNLNFVILDDPRSQLCGSITVSKFGVDAIFAVIDIVIL